MDRYCQYCKDKKLTKFQKKFCSQSCHFKDLNECKVKWATEITPEMHEIIEGLLLSDGSLELNKTCNYPRLSVSQMENKLEYLEFLADKLNIPRHRIKFKAKYHKKLDKTYGSYCLTTSTSPIWTSYYKRWYPEGKKVIPKDFKVTPTSLLHTYIGDGSIYSYIANKKFNPKMYTNVYLYLMDFEHEDIKEILIPQFVDKNIYFKVNLKKHKGYDRLYPVLQFGDKRSLSSFFSYLTPNEVGCYNYKFECISN